MRASEGSCDGDWVFNNNGKTRTWRWTSALSFTWAVAWSLSTWGRERLSCPRTIFFHQRDGLAAGAFIGATGLKGPANDFSTCATGLQPALLLGRPGLEGPPCLRFFSTCATGLRPAVLLERPGLEGPA